MSQLNYYDLHTLSCSGLSLTLIVGAVHVVGANLFCVYIQHSRSWTRKIAHNSPGELFVTSVNLAEWVICKISSQVLLV